MPTDDPDLLAAIEEPTPEQERIAAALAELDQVPQVYGRRAHDADCWLIHAECLAARIRRTLTESEDR